MGDTFGLQFLLDDTDRALVSFELEIGWATAAGVDVAALLGANAGRFSLAHVKDVAASTVPNFAFRQDPAPVGQGVIDFASLLPKAYEAGVRAFFVEQEAPFAGDRLEAMAKYNAYLAGLRARKGGSAD